MKLKNLIAGACALCGFAVSAQAETVSYWDPVGKVMKSADATVVTADTTTLGSGWYVVKDEVVRDNTIGVTGTANLILVEGAKLTVTGGDRSPGIRVTNANALTIWGRGELSATGTTGGAGIGGGVGEACGVLTINGGRVTAQGSAVTGTDEMDCGAGIGGGFGGDGGTVTINDGTVEAKRAKNGYSFGSGSGGSSYSPTRLKVNGGSVLMEKGSAKLYHPKMGVAGTPINDEEKDLVPVEFSGFSDAARIVVAGLDGYGTESVFSVDGKVVFYLPVGRYTFTLDGVAYWAVVENTKATLERPSSGYTLLDYVESTGTQYVNTGYKSWGSSTRILCDFYAPDLTERAKGDPALESQAAFGYLSPDGTSDEANVSFAFFPSDVLGGTVAPLYVRAEREMDVWRCYRLLLWQ